MASRKIGALWLRKSESGKAYMSGVIQDLRGDIQIAIFKNDKKQEGSKQPDYNILLSGERPKPKTAEAPAESGEAVPF